MVPHAPRTAGTASALLALLLLGCADRTAGTPVQPAITGIGEARQEIATARANVDRTIASLGAIGRGDAAQGSFEDFSADLTEASRSERRVREEYERMKANSAEYVRRWQRDPARRAAGGGDDGAVEELFAKAEASYDDLARVYGPFLARLDDIHGALRHDAGPEAVRSLAPAIATATAEAEAIRTRADEVLRRLDALTRAPAPDAAARR